jgi:hypothetical protein
MLDLAAAMDGPFRDWYGGTSWNAWRTAAKAAYAVPMTAEEISFFKTISGGREPPRRRVREWWCCIGRGGGKDSIMSGDAAISAATFDPSILRPGERALVLCVATDKDTARIIRRYIGAFFELIPAFKRMVTRETEDGLELSNRVDVTVMAGNFRSVRGRPLLRAILDECAFYRSDDSSTPDTELYRALLPGMRLPQSMMVGISSPYKKSGILYKRYCDHFGKESNDVLVIQAESTIMNPTLDTRERDRAMAEDPVSARSEYGAVFRDDLVCFIDPAVVARAVVAGRIELPPVSGIVYTAGVDPSGGSSDSMTLAISHAEGERGILDGVWEWQAPFSPEQVVQEITAICRRYGIRSVIGDRFGGEWPRERFRVHGIEYVIAPMTRSDTYLHLLPALNTPGKIELVDNRRLISQLCGLERRTGHGKDSVDHARGAHDDVINAAAISLCAAALTPMSAADGWLMFMDRQLTAAGGALPRGTDVDGVRLPGGWNFNNQPLIGLVVPPRFTAEFGMTVDITMSEARARLSKPGPWRDYNRPLLKALGIEEVA